MTAELTDEQRAALDFYLPLSVFETSPIVIGGNFESLFTVDVRPSDENLSTDLATAIVHHVNNYAALERERDVLRAALLPAAGRHHAAHSLGVEAVIAHCMDEAREQIGG